MQIYVILLHLMSYDLINLNSKNWLRKLADYLYLNCIGQLLQIFKFFQSKIKCRIECKSILSLNVKLATANLNPKIAYYIFKVKQRRSWQSYAWGIKSPKQCKACITIQIHCTYVYRSQFCTQMYNIIYHALNPKIINSYPMLNETHIKLIATNISNLRIESKSS